MEIIQYAKDTVSTIVDNLRPESATLAGAQQKPALVLALLVVVSAGSLHFIALTSTGDGLLSNMQHDDLKQIFQKSQLVCETQPSLQQSVRFFLLVRR
jgi:hypothetical protein